MTGASPEVESDSDSLSTSAIIIMETLEISLSSGEVRNKRVTHCSAIE